MDSLHASYRFVLTGTASGGCFCNAPGQTSAIAALLDGVIAVMESSLLSCRVRAFALDQFFFGAKSFFEKIFLFAHHLIS